LKDTNHALKLARVKERAAKEFEKKVKAEAKSE
jgi:hypothetical protein